MCLCAGQKFEHSLTVTDHNADVALGGNEFDTSDSGARRVRGAPSFQSFASHGKSRHSLLLLKSSPVPPASECVLSKVFDARGI